jgi:hypothetical protein
LSGDDEQFLEAALDDRKVEVRRRAAQLLARLPDSAFTRRAVARARGLLQVERRGLRRRLAVTLPEPVDDIARRDGLRPSSPYPSIGDQAWHLLQVVAAAPLSLWTDDLHLDAATLVDLEVVDDFGAVVHAGWRRAARAQHNRTWAEALLGSRHASYRAAYSPGDDQLVPLLPAAARVDRAAGLLRASRPTPEAAAALLACPVPWPAALTDAVLAHVAAQLGSAEPAPPGTLPQLIGRSAGLAGGRDVAGHLRDLADRFRIRTAAVPAAGRWAAPLERAGAVLELRRRFLQELQ